MKVIGLTGGIGSGKSTVSEFLRPKGYCIIDADQIAHTITEKGSPVLRQLADVFGSEILFDDGSLNRKKLAAIAFSDRQRKQQLEDITTRRVLEIIEEKLAIHLKNDRERIVFLDAPLLFETGADALTDVVWLVDAEQELRICRTMERDGVSREDVLRRIANQLPDAEKRIRAGEIIDNGKGKEDLYRRVEGLLEKYDQGKQGK